MEPNLMPDGPPARKIIITRNGHSIASTVPLPTVLVDTREQTPWTFTAHGKRIGSTRTATLQTGDYTVVGMEGVLALERKGMGDIIQCVAQPPARERFLRECERLAGYRHKAILIEASYEALKCKYADQVYSGIKAYPNAVVGTLDAIEARWGIPIIYTSRNVALAEEKAAAWLAMHYTYWFLETHGLGRILNDGDL